MYPRYATVILSAVLMSLLACGSDDPLTPGQLSGAYRLTLTDGHSPPQFVDTMGGCSLFLTAGGLRIKTDGTHELGMRMRRCGFEFTYDYSGSYSVSGRRVDFTTSNSTEFSGDASVQGMELAAPFTFLRDFSTDTVIVNSRFQQVCEGDECVLTFTESRSGH